MQRIKNNICSCIQQLMNGCGSIDSVEYRCFSQMLNSVKYMSETFDDKIKQVDRTSQNCHIYVSTNPSLHATQLIGSLYILLQTGMNVFFEFDTMYDATEAPLIKVIRELSRNIDNVHIITSVTTQNVAFHSRTSW